MKVYFTVGDAALQRAALCFRRRLRSLNVLLSIVVVVVVVLIIT